MNSPNPQDHIDRINALLKRQDLTPAQRKELQKVKRQLQKYAQ